MKVVLMKIDKSKISLQSFYLVTTKEQEAEIQDHLSPFQANLGYFLA
jgi:hypothetical protein